MADEKSGHYRDLEAEAKTTTEDLYELLGVSFDSTHSEIKRQYRKTSIKYHPDKNPDPAATEVFHLLGRARDILLDENLKSLYDTARVKRKEKALRDELVTGKRRKAKEDLERREAEAALGKRKMGEDEMERVSIAADMQRRREELGERRRREAEEREVRYRMQKAKQAPSAPAADGGAVETAIAGDSVHQESEVDSTVKVRFCRAGDAAGWDEKALSDMFSKYGPIEGVVIGKDKKTRQSEDEKHRNVTATVFVAFERLSSAHAAVIDAKTAFPLIESASWAGREPLLHMPRKGQYPVFAQPPGPTGTKMEGILATGTAADAPPSGFSPKKLDLWEMTMMRLKVAEKKRLQDLLKSQAAAADVAAPTTSQKPTQARTDTGDLHDSTIARLKQAEKKRLEDEIRRREAAEEAEDMVV